MAKAKSKSKSSYQNNQLAYWAAGLGLVSVATLLPTYFYSKWIIPLNGAMSWYYGVAMALAVLGAAWLVMKPKNGQAASVLAVALLVVAIPGLEYVAAAFSDTDSSRAWMHLASTGGPMVLVNLAAVVVAILAFVNLEKK
jgi:hypothetical protein